LTRKSDKFVNPRQRLPLPPWEGLFHSLLVEAELTTPTNCCRDDKAKEKSRKFPSGIKLKTLQHRAPTKGAMACYRHMWDNFVNSVVNLNIYTLIIKDIFLLGWFLIPNEF
jgi:hypothetical protein